VFAGFARDRSDARLSARLLVTPPCGDTCRNISFGIKDLRAIKVRTGGRFFKLLRNGMCGDSRAQRNG
jgi:hypothetical protein